MLQAQQRRRRNIRRGLSLVVLAAFVVIIVLLLSNNSKPAANKTTTTTTTTAPTASSTTTPTTTPTTLATPSTTFAPPTTAALTTTPVEPTCPTANETTRIVEFKKAPPDCIGKTSVWQATFDTDLGNFVVKMPAAQSYAAVNNFVFLARWNFYNGTFFHRVIPGFVIQGGDPSGTGTGGGGKYPGYEFTGNYPPESCTTKVTAPCYHTGDFVLANSNPNSGTQNASTDGSQFFVVLPGGAATLNGEPTYTKLGSVTSGLSVVEKIGGYGQESGTPRVKVYVLKVTVKQLSS